MSDECALLMQFLYLAPLTPSSVTTDKYKVLTSSVFLPLIAVFPLITDSHSFDLIWIYFKTTLSRLFFKGMFNNHSDDTLCYFISGHNVLMCGLL